MNYFFSKNNWNLVKEQFKKTDEKYNDFEYELQIIFKSYLCCFSDIKEWVSILENAYFNEIMEMTTKHARDIYKSYGFRPIETILNDSSFSDFEKVRKIRNIMITWKPYRYENQYYSDFLHFSLDDWKYFVKKFPIWIDSDVILPKMMEQMKVHQSTTKNSSGYYHVNFANYNNFPYNEIVVKNAENKIIPLTSSIIEGYFEEDSHFEGEIFWLRNLIPYTLCNEKNEVLTDRIFAENSILDCPWNCCPRDLKEKIKELLYTQTPFEYSFMKEKLNYEGKKSIRHVLEKYFNVLGRVSKHFPLSNLHVSLHEKLKKNVLSLSKIEDATKQILFPEYYFQSANVQKELDDMWEKSKEHFLKKVENVMFGKFYNVFYTNEPPKDYCLVEKDLTYFFEKKSLFDYITEHKRAYKFINIDNLLCEPLQKEKPTIKSFGVQKIEKYLEPFLEKKKKKET
jgi:hypothetical protein